MGKHTLAYAQSWPTSSGGPVATHHIYRDDAMPDGVMIHQHVADDNRMIWVPDSVWERAVKRDKEGSDG